MPTIAPAVTQSTYIQQDASGVYALNGTPGQLRIGFQGSSIQNMRGLFRVGPINIAKGANVSAFAISFHVDNAAANPPTWVKGVQLDPNAAIPTTPADFNARVIAVETQAVQASVAAGVRILIDYTAQLQALVNESDWESGGDGLFYIATTAQFGPTVNRFYLASPASGTAVNRPTAEATYTNASPVTANIVGATLTPVQGGPIYGGSGELPPVEAQIVGGTLTPVVGGPIVAGTPDKSRHSTHAIHRPNYDNHYFLLESGELIGFQAEFSKVLGNARTGISGQTDNAWLSEIGDLAREPAPLEFTARLLGKTHTKSALERFRRLVPFARELWLPDGSRLPIDHAQVANQEGNNALAITASPRGAIFYHPLLELGDRVEVFETVSSTPELPIVALDPSGSLTGPFGPTTAPRGRICVAVKIAERGAFGVASVGPAPETSGVPEIGGSLIAFVDNRYRVQVGDLRVSVPEAEVGPLMAWHVLILSWDQQNVATFYSRSQAVGFRSHVIGSPEAFAALAESILTVGTTTGSTALEGFVVPGAPSYDFATFAPLPCAEQEAQRITADMLAALSDPSIDYTIRPPEYAIEIARANSETQRFEVVASEAAVNFDFLMTRLGGFTPELEVTAKGPSGLVVGTPTRIGVVDNVETWRVPIQAPAGYAESLYGITITAKAVGADNPGSFLANARGSWTNLLQVAAAGPAIADNATFVLQSYDPIQHRAAEFIRDASSNANPFAWHGLARGNAIGDGILCTGVYDAAVSSGTLTNGTIAHRLNASQTFCFYATELGIGTAGRTLFQLAGQASNDGVRIERATGGLKLRTVIGATEVLSAGTLAVGAAEVRFALRLDKPSNTVYLYNRDTGAQISLALPAFADTGVRVAFGATRSAAGVNSNLGRYNQLAAAGFPYLLSEINQRRTLDKMLEYGKRDAATKENFPAEYPDAAYLIAEFNDTGGGADPNEKFKNRAAPALAIALYSTGVVATPAGTGTIEPNGQSGTPASHVGADLGIPGSERVSAVTVIDNWRDSTDYYTHFGFSDTGKTPTGALITRHANHQPFPMVTNPDFSNTYGTISVSPAPGNARAGYYLEVWNTGQSLKAEHMPSGKSRTITISGNAYTGNYRANWGALKYGNGTFGRRSKTRNAGTVAVRGAMTAQEKQNSLDLLNRELVY